MARSLYGTRSSLVLRRTEGVLSIDGEEVDSVIGTKQGCTLGAFLFCVGLHFCLMVTAALHPTACVTGYMDDVYTQNDRPTEAWAAACTFRSVASAHCRLSSNLDKLGVYSPRGDLSFLPPSVPGHPSQPLQGLKVMGSFLSADASWAAQQLADMVPKKLKNLAGLDSLHDTERVRTAAQGKLLLIRHCANAAPTSWLRLNAPDVTAIAALTHDTLIDQPLLDVIGVGAADPAQRARALSQARMPLANFGGLGVASASSTRHAAYIHRPLRLHLGARLLPLPPPP